MRPSGGYNPHGVRRGPRTGYDFGNKRQYRRIVWKSFREGILPLYYTLATAQCLLMPSSEGDEIEVALSQGFREYNLHVVDRDPDIVDSLKHRYRRINTYGVEVEEACRRIAAKGLRLSCANLDLTGCMSDSMFECLRACILSRSFHDQAMVAITMLRGREQGLARAMVNAAPTVTGGVRGFSPQDVVRITTVYGALTREFYPTAEAWRQTDPEHSPARLTRTGYYKSVSGSQTMLYSIWRLVQPR